MSPVVFKPYTPVIRRVSRPEYYNMRLPYHERRANLTEEDKAIINSNIAERQKVYDHLAKNGPKCVEDLAVYDDEDDEIVFTVGLEQEVVGSLKFSQMGATIVKRESPLSDDSDLEDDEPAPITLVDGKESAAAPANPVTDVLDPKDALIAQLLKQVASLKDEVSELTMASTTSKFYEDDAVAKQLKAEATVATLEADNARLRNELGNITVASNSDLKSQFETDAIRRQLAAEMLELKAERESIEMMYVELEKRQRCDAGSLPVAGSTVAKLTATDTVATPVAELTAAVARATVPMDAPVKQAAGTNPPNYQGSKEGQVDCSICDMLNAIHGLSETVPVASLLSRDLIPAKAKTVNTFLSRCDVVRLSDLSKINNEWVQSNICNRKWTDRTKRNRSLNILMFYESIESRVSGALPADWLAAKTSLRAIVNKG